jgi:arylsulfatase A-like enzyme
MISDHGEAFMEHQSLGHGIDLYQETIHVPWMITQLNTNTNSRLHPHTVSHVDVYATLMGMLNRTPLIQNDGINLLAHEINNSRIVYSMLRNLRSPDPFWRAAFQNNRKLVRKGEHDHILFDLTRDPAETYPKILQNPQNDPLYKALETMINEEKTRRGHYEFPDVVVEKLRQLGYVR